MREPPGRKILSVSQVNAEVGKLLDKHFKDLWVKGELGEFTRHSSGHWYFTLKDAKGQLRAVMFKYQNSFLRFRPEEGMEVICRGRVTAYAPRSLYQINVEWMEPVGVGALHLEFERLKADLEQEGLFDPARKKKLPDLIGRVAIITSISGAALQDMLEILRMKAPGVEILIVPSAVQGEGSARSLARALEEVNSEAIARPAGRKPIQAIIIGRGGGSIEDLWAFNEEVLARAIAASSIPVISAVGHEIDFSISDFVADLRAPTPTAAAQMVASGRADNVGAINHAAFRLASIIERRLEASERDLRGLAMRLRDPSRKIDDHAIRVDELSARSEKSMRLMLEAIGEKIGRHSQLLRSLDPRKVYALRMMELARLDSRLRGVGASKIERALHRVEKAEAGLVALSPLNTLSRGYAIARDSNGAVVRDARHMKKGDELEVILQSGRLDCEVKNTRQGEER